MVEYIAFPSFNAQKFDRAWKKGDGTVIVKRKQISDGGGKLITP